jgi:hypothetical protein
MKEKLRVIRKEPNQDPEIIVIDDTLDAMQKEVLGYIEAVTIATDTVVICNEEGLLIGMTPNCRLADHLFFGPILVVGTDEDRLADVPDEAFWMKQIKPWRSA